MKQVILFLTNRHDLYVIEQIQHLLASKDAQTDIAILFNIEGNLPESLIPYENMIFRFSNDIIYEMGYSPLGDNLVYGNCHFPVLKYYLAHQEYEFYWTIEDDVMFNGKWSTLFNFYKKDSTDLLSAYVSKISDTPNWMWWSTLVTGNEVVPVSEKISSFNPIYRLSNRALRTIHNSLQNGWGGHAEAVLASILAHNGLTIKDIGGTGTFTPKNDKKRFYSNESHYYLSLDIQDLKPDTIYHPIKRKKGTDKLRRNCVISAVGKSSLHKNWTKGEENRSFDLHLIVYDNSFGLFYNDGDFVSAKKGFKLRLVYDYLKNNPEYLNAYDYFFIPDDDIMTDAKEIEKLFKTMKQYDLKIAQPALHDSYYTYPITLRDTLCKLRYTTFVEMMLPCFSREALVKILDTFNANISGWGTEYHWPKLIGSKGTDMAILDNVSMVHTQPVKQGRQKNVQEMQSYMRENDLTFDVREISCIPLYSRQWEGTNFELIRLNRNKLVQQVERKVDMLLQKIYSREMVRRGLDGICGLALLCLEVGKISGKAHYVSAGKSLMGLNENVALDFDSMSFQSFYAGDLGIIWAYKRFRNYYHQSVASINKYLSPVCQIKDIKKSLGYDWRDISTMDTVAVMYALLKFIMKNKKSELNQMLFECWSELQEAQSMTIIKNKK